jgi:hypothetical protein
MNMQISIFYFNLTLALGVLFKNRPILNKEV